MTYGLSSWHSSLTPSSPFLSATPRAQTRTSSPLYRHDEAA
jgi:hypothetical protein